MSLMSSRFIPILAWLAMCSPVAAQEKLNFQEHVLPLIQANCAKCHNPDKKKADLDLTSFQAVLKGGGSGPAVVSGNPDASKLWRALAHAEEPFMPPNAPKLPDKELSVFKQWIAGGLLENAGAQAIAAAKAGVDLELKVDAPGKPDGPPAMPVELPLDPVAHTVRRSAITGLAASPWAPLVAVAGQKQVLLFNSETLECLGILPFPEGQPIDLKFSGSGKLLLASGGQAAKSGKIVLWDVVTGEPLVTLGKDEYDSVLAADVRADQAQVAAGGPSRLVKIYSVSTGEVQHRIKKHTDWVTAVAYSPNGQMLASADRNGAICIWDPDSGQELFTLTGHKNAVTALSWRSDSKLLASASEDGTARLWDVQEAKQVKSWTANPGGALCISFAADGQLVTCGRDNALTIWNANGGTPRPCQSPGTIPIRAVFSSDAKRVVASDFDGKVGVWTVADQKRIGDLDPNPVPLATRIAEAQSKVSELQARVDAARAVIASADAEVGKIADRLEAAKKALEVARAAQAEKQAEVTRLSQQVGLTNAPAELPATLAAVSAAWGEACARSREAHSVVEASTKDLESARAAAAKAKHESPAADLMQARQNLAKWEAAQGLTLAWRVRPSLTAKRREYQRVAATLEADRRALKQAEEDLASAKAAIAKAEAQIKTAGAEVARNEPAAKELAEAVAAEQSKLDGYLNQYRAASTNLAVQVTQAK
jgi:hypothetical protein